jgi:threonine dehydrogenase-like Zn-dependent dehydrogenase
MELVPGTLVHPLREDLPAAELTVFECLSHAVTWVHPVREGDVVVIEGPGHMGLACVAARAAGAGTVVVTGLSRDRVRLEAALRVGADHAVDVESKDVVKFVADLTGEQMAEVVLDAAAGNPVTIPLGLELARVGGSLVVAGMKDRPLDAAVHQVEAQGGAVLAPPGDSPTGHMGTVADPMGAMFRLVEVAAWPEDPNR